MEEYDLSTKQALSSLQVSNTKLAKLVKDGKISRIKTEKGAYKYSSVELEKFKELKVVSKSTIPAKNIVKPDEIVETKPEKAHNCFGECKENTVVNFKKKKRWFQFWK